MSLIDDDTPAWLEPNILSRICDVSPRGETLAQMFDRCLDFDSKADFALAVRRCVAEGRLVHIGPRYYHPSHPTQAIAKAVPIVKTPTRRKPYQRRKHFGNLLPSSDLGRVALVLCVFERHMPCEEVAEHAKVTAAHRHLVNLCNCLYAYQRGIKVHTYCWSKSVDYPFAKFDDSDFTSLSLPSMKVDALRKRLCPVT